jgi:hypothetical protein
MKTTRRRNTRAPTQHRWHQAEQSDLIKRWVLPLPLLPMPMPMPMPMPLPMPTPDTSSHKHMSITQKKNPLHDDRGLMTANHAHVVRTDDAGNDAGGAAESVNEGA